MHLSEVAGKVDFGIITTREDEFKAVLARFPASHRVIGRRHYNLCRVDLPDGGSYLVAVLRCLEQGNGEAQSAAHDLLEDLDPRWLLVVGIAGGVPSDDFSLGDVIVSTRIHDFNVEAVLQGSSSEWALAGGAVGRDAAALVANLPALREELGPWNAAGSIAAQRPKLTLTEAAVYGGEEWISRVHSSLMRHAGRNTPLAVAGAIASSDRLIKDTELLAAWMKMARQVLAVEMESAGVYRATYGRQVPALSVRGISDIIGLKRDPLWTQYACHTAAAFALALVRTQPFKPKSQAQQGAHRPVQQKTLADPAPVMGKPRVFIGASAQGLKTAEFIQLGLDHHAECTIGAQGAFGLAGSSLEGLSRTARSFDLAILVLTPGDLAHEQTVARSTSRDNVLFELGLFTGVLGSERTYVVYCREDRISLPTDLAGVTAITFGRRMDGNLQAAVGPVCTQIKAALEKDPVPREVSSEGSGTAALSSVSAQLEALRADFSAQTEHIRRMMEILTSERVAPAQRTDTSFFRKLEGAWKNPRVGSIAYARIVGGELRFVYCYGGNENLTAEYYSWRLVNDAVFARFRWLNEPISGYAYFEEVSENRLRGGWWYSTDVSEALIHQLPRVEGREAIEWVRLDAAAAVPPWAAGYFEQLQRRQK